MIRLTSFDTWPAFLNTRTSVSTWIAALSRVSLDSACPVIVRSLLFGWFEGQTGIFSEDGFSAPAGPGRGR
jgi:hypothetical protein